MHAGEYKNLTFEEKYFRSYKARDLRLELGDIKAIYFLRMQTKNSSFLYAMDLDDEGRLKMFSRQMQEV